MAKDMTPIFNTFDTAADRAEAALTHGVDLVNAIDALVRGEPGADRDATVAGLAVVLREELDRGIGALW